MLFVVIKLIRLIMLFMLLGLVIRRAINANIASQANQAINQAI